MDQLTKKNTFKKKNSFPSKNINKNSPNISDTSISGSFIPATAVLQNFREAKVKSIKFDCISNASEIVSNNLTISIKDQLTKLSPTMHRLFDYILTEYSRTHILDVVLDIGKISERFGIKHKRSLMSQLLDDVRSLRSIWLSYKSNDHKKSWNRSFGEINLFTGWYWKKENKSLIITINQTLGDYLSTCPIMPFNNSVFQIQLNHHPHSGYLESKLRNHFNMNKTKSNSNIISVKSLLNSCPYLPTVDEATPDLTKRIIRPFIRDLESLEPNILKSWHFLNKNKEPLTEKQNAIQTYQVLILCYIFFELA